MSEFTKVFTKGANMANHYDYSSIIMLCKNIDFSHVRWIHVHSSFYNDVQCMVHIIDNIIDINAHDNNDNRMYTFFTKIMQYSTSSYIMHYMLNNGYVNDDTFSIYSKYGYLDNTCNWHGSCKCCPNKRFDKLVNYLTMVSLNRFKGYYNIEKYYDMMITMLLILKAQQRVPSAVIKHLIIPFIYQ